MIPPKITLGPNSLELCYNGSGLTIRANLLHDGFEKHVCGEVCIFACVSDPVSTPDKPITKTISLEKYHALDFSGSTGRRDLASIMTHHGIEGETAALVSADAVNRIIEHHRTGEAMVKALPSCDVIPPVQYLLFPFLPLGQATILFGARSSGKSEVATSWAVYSSLDSVHLEGIRTRNEPINTLWLDYEQDQAAFQRTQGRLFNGLGIKPFEIYYRPCSRPIPDDIDHIINMVLDSQCNLLIIDSLGPAAGKEITGSDAAILLHNGIRSILNMGVTILYLAHPPKGLQSVKSVYGSVFFENLARSIWFIERKRVRGSEIAFVRLQNTKPFQSDNFPDLAYQITYSGQSINYVSIPVEQAFPEADEGSRDVILTILQGGNLDYPALESESGMSRNTLRQLMKRLVDEGDVHRFGTKQKPFFGLAQ